MAAITYSGPAVPIYSGLSVTIPPGASAADVTIRIPDDFYATYAYAASGTRAGGHRLNVAASVDASIGHNPFVPASRDYGFLQMLSSNHGWLTIRLTSPDDMNSLESGGFPGFSFADGSGVDFPQNLGVRLFSNYGTGGYPVDVVNLNLDLIPIGTVQPTPPPVQGSIVLTSIVPLGLFVWTASVTGAQQSRNRSSVIVIS